MPWVLPVIHPAAILRGQFHEEPAQVTYLKRARQLFLGAWVPRNVELPPPETWLWPTLGTLRNFDSYLSGANWNALAIDIENAGKYITLIGLTAMDMEKEQVGATLSLPFRVRYGQRYWTSYTEHRRAVEYLYDWLACPRLAKVFHNGVAHDVPILERDGFKVEGELWDTMVMTHHCYPEMKKGLSYCSTLYLGLNNWKLLLNEDDEDEAKA